MKIRFQGKPLAGVRVAITSYVASGDTKTWTSGSTTPDGSFTVTNLPPGDYWIHSDLFGIVAGSQCFHVSPQSSLKARRSFKFDWGNYPQYTRRLGGKFVDFKPGDGDTPLLRAIHAHEAPGSSVTLILHSPVSPTVYRTQTDANGNFDFPDVPNGAYVLDVLDSHLLIRLDPKAGRPALRLVNHPSLPGNCGTYVEVDDRAQRN